MPLQIDAFNKLILVTSPTTEVDAQTLHDFVEDYMATPVGMANDGQWPGSTSNRGDILKPEGKIEDENNPGQYSQIILIMHPQWQIQFWQGSGYSRVYGGKIVGGVSGQPLKATGAAGDISVLESPVDGVTVVSGSGLSAEQDTKLDKIATRLDLNPLKQQKYANDGSVIVNTQFTLTKIDNGDGTFDIEYSTTI